MSLRRSGPRMPNWNDLLVHAWINHQILHIQLDLPPGAEPRGLEFWKVLLSTTKLRSKSGDDVY